MKVLSIIFLYIFLVSLGHADSEKLKPKENEAWLKIKDWTVMLEFKQKAALAFHFEKNEPKKNPSLDISCFLPNNNGDGFDMGLNSGSDFKTKDPSAVDTMVFVDNNTPIGDLWFPAGKRLETVKPRSLIKDMLQGEEFHIRYREVSGLKEYSYKLGGLAQVIKTMEKVCGYKFDGSN